MAEIVTPTPPNITPNINDVFSFRVSKSLLSANGHQPLNTGVETMLYSDDTIIQFSDDSLVEW